MIKMRFSKTRIALWFMPFFGPSDTIIALGGIAALHRSEEPLFGERNGYVKVWPKWPARWRFQLLTPVRPFPVRQR